LPSITSGVVQQAEGIAVDRPDFFPRLEVVTHHAVESGDSDLLTVRRLPDCRGRPAALEAVALGFPDFRAGFHVDGQEFGVRHQVPGQDDEAIGKDGGNAGAEIEPTHGHRSS